MGTVAPQDSDAGVDAPTSIWPTIAGFAATRLVGNLFVRFPYVFINQISKGLGVDVETLTYVFGARELGGLVAPKAGHWVDRGHTGRVIVVGGLLAGASCVAAATSWFPLFVVVMVLGGAAKISIDLAQNAWIGHNVPLATRGRVIGLIEMTWAGAFLAGVPAVGWAVDRWGWQAAFVVTGPLLTIAALGSGSRVREAAADSVVTNGPMESVGAHETGDQAATIEAGAAHVRVDADAARLKRAVWVFCFLQPMAQMLIFAVYGDWFTTEVKLSTTALSVVTALLGVAELIGTIVTVWITDRAGPIRCGMWGMALTIPPMLGVIAVGPSAVSAAALLIAMDIAIEFAFVSVLPVVSELDVENRGKAVGHVFVLIMVARAIGSAVSGRIYEMGGFNAALTAAAIASFGASGVLWWSRRSR